MSSYIDGRISNAVSLTQQEQIDQLREAINETCLSGGEFAINADGNGNISFKGILPGLSGKVDANIKRSKGAVGYINEQIRQITDKDIRDCLERQMPLLYKVILRDTQSLNGEGSSRTIIRSNFLSDAEMDDAGCGEALEKARQGAQRKCHGVFKEISFECPGSFDNLNVYHAKVNGECIN